MPSQRIPAPCGTKSGGWGNHPDEQFLQHMLGRALAVTAAKHSIILFAERAIHTQHSRRPIMTRSIGLALLTVFIPLPPLDLGLESIVLPESGAT
jgi:hypothetical protein